MLLVSEGSLSPVGKNLRNRLAVFVADNRVGIKKTKGPSARNFAADGRLSAPHETDQDKISDRLGELHTANTIAEGRRYRQLLNFMR